MNVGRRRTLGCLGGWPAAAWITGPGMAQAAPPDRPPGQPVAVRPPQPWAVWDSFVQQFIGDGGRVVETADARQRTVSEAQAYAMFFALVANQPELFGRLLRWTEDNLAGGDLAQRLPAWLWGRRDDGSWGVVDDNAAADADLWIAHTLGEAGRLWGVPRYTALSQQLAARIQREEVAELPGLGPMLLPAPRGFEPVQGRWRLNPSYLPPLQLRWFASRFGGPWQALHDNALRLLRESAPGGLAPDWAVWDGTRQRFEPADGGGSYDAIRVYLWLGLSAAWPGVRPTLTHFAPMAALVDARGVPPETWGVPASVGTAATAATPSGTAPGGFSAALLPFLQALGQPAAVRRQLALLQARPAAPDAYYDRVLRLFGEGAHTGRYRFDAAGGLVPAWRPPAARVSSSQAPFSQAPASRAPAPPRA